MIENPLMSVRSPGTALDNEKGKLKATNPVEGVRNNLPDLLPDCPSLEVRLQNVKQEGRESEDVGVNEVGHG
jgi:hypothetical protein